MLGQSYAANRGTRKLFRWLGANEKTCLIAGAVVGGIVAIKTLDPVGAKLQFVDIADTASSIGEVADTSSSIAETTSSYTGLTFGSGYYPDEGISAIGTTPEFS